METDLQAKADELNGRLAAWSLKKIDSSSVVKIRQLENEMVENRMHLVALLERGIVNEAEIKAKIATCFNVFLMAIAASIGTERCRAIYDYAAGENLAFLDSPTQQIDTSDVVGKRSAHHLHPAYQGAGANAGFVPLAVPPLTLVRRPLTASYSKPLSDLLNYADKIGIADAVEVLRHSYVNSQA